MSALMFLFCRPTIYICEVFVILHIHVYFAIQAAIRIKGVFTQMRVLVPGIWARAWSTVQLSPSHK